MSLTDLVAVAVLAFVGVRLAEAARESTRSQAWNVVRTLRARHLVLALVTLAAVLAAAIVLWSVPGLSWGWWSALGGVGNPVFGETSTTTGTELATVVPLVFLALLVPALPVLVTREEWAFRRGAQHRSPARNAWRAVLFGLAHALIGIPIAAALALSVGGAYLTLAYLWGFRRTGTESGALRESTAAHLAYDLVIVALVAVALVLG